MPDAKESDRGQILWLSSLAIMMLLGYCDVHLKMCQAAEVR